MPPAWRKQILAPIYALCISFVFVLLFAMALREPNKPPDPVDPTRQPTIQPTPPTASAEPTEPASSPTPISPTTVIRAEVVDTRRLDDISIQIWDEELSMLIKEGRLDANGSFPADGKLDGLRVCIKDTQGYQVAEPDPSKTKDHLSCTSLIPATPDVPVVVKLSKPM